MATLSTVIGDIRSKINDTTTSHLVRQETPLGAIDGTNRKYVLAYFPIVAASLTVTVDGTVTVAYTLDSNKGILTMTAAPVSSIVVDYYFQVFTDADITIWIYDATETCDFIDITLVPQTMLPAVEMLVYSLACKAWARKWSEGFSWKIGPEAVDKKEIAKNYQTLAEESFKEGIQLRDDFYTRKGKRQAPQGSLLQYHIPRYDVRR